MYHESHTPGRGKGLAHDISLCYADYMKWAKPGKNQLLTHQTAYKIYQDILLSLESYHDDSTVAKFFLPEELGDHCKSVSASFAFALSSPDATLEEIYDSKLYYLYYLTMMYGTQIYLKEHALRTHHAYYVIEKDALRIEAIKNKVTELLCGEYSVDPASNMVMGLYKNQIHETKQKVQKEIMEVGYSAEDFDRCLHSSLMFGYLFAREMIYIKD